MEFMLELFASSVFPQYVFMFCHIVTACRVPVFFSSLSEHTAFSNEHSVNTANIIVGISVVLVFNCVPCHSLLERLTTKNNIV